MRLFDVLLGSVVGRMYDKTYRKATAKAQSVFPSRDTFYSDSQAGRQAVVDGMAVDGGTWTMKRPTV